LEVHTRSLNLTAAAKHCLPSIAEAANDFTGAELALLCQKAGMSAIREAICSGTSLVEVTEQHLNTALHAQL